MKNNLLLLLTLVLLYACKSNDTTPNRPPNAFTVTPTLKSDGKTIVLNWTKAKDPDGDAVTYAVVLKDTLTKNLSDTTFTLVTLDFNYSQAGKVIAKDAKDLITEASFTATTKTITFVNIPDPIFEKYLIDNKIDKDGIVNGRMNIDDAKGVKAISPTSKNIKSLVGIEAFTDLQFLYCMDNQLLNLDVSKNVALQTLYCYSNQLTVLDISKNVALQQLACDNNKLPALDVSKNLALLELGCEGNQLKTLDISKNVALQTLFCGASSLTSIDVSKNISLLKLFCIDAKLSSLDVTKNKALQILYCDNNKLNTLDLSKNVDLQELHCINDLLTTLDISKNIVLKYLLCNSNLIKTICVADVAKAKINPNWQKDASAVYSVCQ